MGYLDEVKAKLERIGIRTAIGYPGTGAVHVTEPLAAINGSGLDYDAGTAQVTAVILSPRALGLGLCQEKAVFAMAALLSLGKGWHYSGWQFDSNLDCYRVEVVGQIAVVFSGPDLVRSTGWQVTIGEERQAYVTDFLARQQSDRRLIRPHGTPDPVGVTPGVGGWSIKLTQLLPMYEAEPGEPQEPFTLTVTNGDNSQVYQECCWSDYSARKQSNGTLVVRSGFALSREVI